ncbi:MAG: cation-transporting P-type ATPase [Syntrophomonadaceae bacterium]
MEDNRLDVIIIAKSTPDAVLDYLRVPPSGLSTSGSVSRRKEYGPNLFPQVSKLSPLKQFIQQFTHFMAILLWVAGFLALVADMPQLAIATWAIIIINALFSFIQEYRADQALAELAAMLPNIVKVFRDGDLVKLPADQLTVGDLISLEAGDRVPADARVLQASGLFLDNSLLTGESVPVDRNEGQYDLEDKNVTDSSNLVFAGTTVTGGSGRAVVYAVGSRTEIGQVSKLTQSIKRGESTLEIEVKRIARLITLIAFLFGLGAFGVAVWAVGLDPKLGFIFGLGILVANVPEGLLPTVSMSLAIGVQRMAKKNALIRRLSAVETLSAATVICTDKTGTITENQLTLDTIWTPDTAVQFQGLGYERSGSCQVQDGSDRKSLEMLLLASILCSETSIKPDQDDPEYWDIIGTPTEAALLIAAEKYGMAVDAVRRQFSRRDTVPFSSEAKIMRVRVENLANRLLSPKTVVNFSKGAPLQIMHECDRLLIEGQITSLDSALQKVITAKNDDLARQGFRVLGFSYREAVADCSFSSGRNIFLGLAAMADPVRPEVYDAVQKCSRAGIKTTIITGDYGVTAAAIAHNIGLIVDRHHNIPGSDLDDMDDLELEQLLKKDDPIIFSRSTPIHKLRIVEAYKRNGEIVAVTGDGVNDTLALKSSHIGIAMGMGGTDVAREAADMVLLDNNFATIITAIEQGRSIYKNIRKFLIYILSSNVAEFMPFVAMLLAKIPPSLNILQILAIDLGTDLAPAIALGAEKPEQGLLDKPPRKKDESIMNRDLFLRAYAYLGFMEGILSLAIFLYVWSRAGYNLNELRSITGSILNRTASPELINLYAYSTTMAFAAVVAGQIGNLFICRSEHISIRSSFITRNNLVYIGLAFEVLVCMAIVYLPPLQEIFGTKPIIPGDLLLLLLCPLVMIVVEEIRKIINPGIKRKDLSEERSL